MELKPHKLILWQDILRHIPRGPQVRSTIKDRNLFKFHVTELEFKLIYKRLYIFKLLKKRHRRYQRSFQLYTQFEQGWKIQAWTGFEPITLRHCQCSINWAVKLITGELFTLWVRNIPVDSKECKCRNIWKIICDTFELRRKIRRHHWSSQLHSCELKDRKKNGPGIIASPQNSRFSSNFVFRGRSYRNFNLVSIYY